MNAQGRIPGLMPVCGLCLLLSFLGAVGAEASPAFDDDAVLEVTLSGPLGLLLKNAQKKEYLPFTISTGGEPQPVAIRSRGHSRLRVCEFPPLRLKLPEDHASHDVFAGLNRVKLVTHCRNTKRGEQDLLKEYAAYRVFNAVTEFSYRVRLLQIHYIDSDGVFSDAGETYYGFLIEPKEDFAARTGMQPVAREGFPLNRHDRRSAALMYVTQYLLGNTDWMLLMADYDEECCHNLDLFELDSQIMTVAYDFDLAGLVNASYARPDPKLRIRRVTQRLYRGLCTDRSYLEEAVETVISRQEEILEMVQDVPGLEPGNRERAITYLGKFFEAAENRQRLLDLFERRCLDGY